MKGSSAIRAGRMVALVCLLAASKPAEAGIVEVTYDLSRSTVFFANNPAGPASPVGTMTLAYSSVGSTIVNGPVSLKSGSFSQVLDIGTGVDADSGTMAFTLTGPAPGSLTTGSAIAGIGIHGAVVVTFHCGFWCSVFGGVKTNNYVVSAGASLGLFSSTAAVPVSGTHTVAFSPSKTFGSLPVGSGIPVSVTIVGQEISRTVVPEARPAVLLGAGAALVLLGAGWRWRARGGTTETSPGSVSAETSAGRVGRRASK